MKNKGFTLIELLAVIIILAIIMIIAIPSVTNYINNSRKESYVDTAKELLRGAVNLVNSGELEIFDPNTTYYIPSSCIKTETGTSQSPFGKFNPAYIITTYDGESYNYYWTSKDEASMGVPKPVSGYSLSAEHIESNVGEITTDYGIGNRDNIQVYSPDCTESTGKVAVGRYNENDLSGKVIPIKNCEYSGALIQGATFTEGQYTYKYNQEATYNGWKDISGEGWGVVLTDKETSEPIDTQICTKINGKPIISMAYMFANAKNSPSIDVTSFDTSNVTNMQAMFSNTFKLVDTFEIKGIENFDTSKVTLFNSLFSNAGRPSVESIDLDLSKWNTSNVTRLNYIISGMHAKSINVNMSGWNLDKVTYFDSMFSDTGAGDNYLYVNVSNWHLGGITSQNYLFAYFGRYNKDATLDVTNVRFPNATNLYGAFYNTGYGGKKVAINGLTTWDMSNVRDVSYMFNIFGAQEFDIDLSDWDTSNITNFASMFRNLASGIKTAKIKMKNWKIRPNATLYDMFAYSFYGAETVEIDMSGWNLEGKTKYESFLGWTSSVSNRVYVNMSNWKTTGLTSLDNLFEQAFRGSRNIVFDLYGWDTSQVTSAKYMFYSFAGGSESVTLNGFSNWNFSNLKDTTQMFYRANHIHLDNPSFAPENAYGMFYEAYDLSGSITLRSNPTNYSNFFAGTTTYSSFRLNYTSAVTDIDNIMNTRGTYNPNPNIMKGSQV